MIALAAAVFLAARAPDPWSKPIIVLDASNFTEAVDAPGSKLLIEFYAPWWCAARCCAILCNSP